MEVRYYASFHSTVSNYGGQPVPKQDPSVAQAQQKTANSEPSPVSNLANRSSTVPFLQSIFPLELATYSNASDSSKSQALSDLYIRFTLISEYAPWPGKTEWMTLENLHTTYSDPNELFAKLLPTANGETNKTDVYFTPHLFTRTDPYNRVTKDDAAPFLSAAWVECDDSDLIPQSFIPQPSYIVETSPGRHHVYWILDTPQPSQEVEQLNWRLVKGNNLRKDTGGWHLVKLMRLPGTQSFKRPTPSTVRLVPSSLPSSSSDPDPNPDPNTDRLSTDNTLYSDTITHPYPIAFEALPTPATNEAGQIILTDMDQAPLPSPEDLPDPTQLFNDTSRPIPKELQDIIDNKRSDRSATLFRAYALCQRENLTETEAYALLQGTANDKFNQDWRYNGDEGLWQDLQRGYRHIRQPEDTTILNALKAVRHTKGMNAAERRRKISQLVAKDLMSKGRLYFDTERQEAMFYDGKRVIPIDPTNRAWKVLLNLNYHITESEDEYRPVNANLYAIVAQQGEKTVPKTFSYYDAEHNFLYVYNNGGKIYRLNGRTVELVDNGTDGILFRDSNTSSEFLVEPEQIALPTLSTQDQSQTSQLSPLDHAIFAVPNYADRILDQTGDSSHTTGEAAALSHIWALSMFFPEFMEARPHLVMTGGTGSGKTIFFQLLKRMIDGNRGTVDVVPHDQQTFETAVSNAHHLFFDNVDTPNRWFADAIAEASTGIQFTRRILYSTNESVTFDVQVFLGFTTRDPWFSRTDIATRLLVLNTKRRSSMINPTVLHDRVRKHRNALWGQLLAELSIIVKYLGLYKASDSSIRMAAFADFINIVCTSLPYIHAMSTGNVIEGTLVPTHSSSFNDDAPVKATEALTRIMSHGQSTSALDHSIIWQCLSSWLYGNTERNSGRTLTAANLQMELRYVAQEIGSDHLYEKLVPNARSLGHQLSELAPDIDKLVDVHIERKPPTAKYTFTLKDDGRFPDEEQPG